MLTNVKPDIGPFYEFSRTGFTGVRLFLRSSLLYFRLAAVAELHILDGSTACLYHFFQIDTSLTNDLVMLTKKEVTQLYRDGLEVRLRRKRHPEKLKGDYDPSRFEISIFPTDLVSEFEFGITLLHEFIHARDDRNGVLDKNDEKVETEARETNDKRPHILEFIKDLYRIDDLKDYKNRTVSGRIKT
jgi:hypothetical protein